jgi:hypothetical protein
MNKIFLLLIFLFFSSQSFALTTIVRPNEEGDSTNWTKGGADSGSNFGQVDETSSNDDTDYVTTTNTSEVDDLYNVGTFDFGTATINQIQVFLVGKSVLSGSTGSTPADRTFKILIKEGGTTTATDGEQIGSSYEEISNIWTTNPRTSAAWLQASIDDLQIGVRSNRGTGSGNRVKDPRVTQMYVVVTYTPLSTGVHRMIVLFDY